MTTREERKTALNAAIQQSKNGTETFVLIGKGEIRITQNPIEAKAFVRCFGYRLYAKAKDGYMIL